MLLSKSLKVLCTTLKQKKREARNKSQAPLLNLGNCFPNQKTKKTKKKQLNLVFENSPQLSKLTQKGVENASGQTKPFAPNKQNAALIGFT